MLFDALISVLMRRQMLSYRRDELDADEAPEN